MDKESTCNAKAPGDAGSVSRLGGSPGGGNGNRPQDSFLKSSMDRGAWWAAIGSQRVRHDGKTEHKQETLKHRMDTKQGPIVQHRKLYLKS